MKSKSLKTRLEQAYMYYASVPLPLPPGGAAPPVCQPNVMYRIIVFGRNKLYSRQASLYSRRMTESTCSAQSAAVFYYR